jgi:hypothetical protein
VPEPVEYASLVQQAEPHAGAADGAERDGGDLFGGEGAVGVEQAEQEVVPAGQPGRLRRDA